jgi:hypothetical protein
MYESRLLFAHFCFLFLFEAAHRRCQYITSSAYTTPFNQSTRLQYAPTVGVDAPQLLSFPLFLGGGVAAQTGVGAGFFRSRSLAAFVGQCFSVFWRGQVYLRSRRTSWARGKAALLSLNRELNSSTIVWRIGNK